MVIVKGDKQSEAGVLPSQEILAEMGKFNEQLVKAGVMLAADFPHKKSKRVGNGLRPRTIQNARLAAGAGRPSEAVALSEADGLTVSAGASRGELPPCAGKLSPFAARNAGSVKSI
jgi:hypothetical protein